MAGGVRGLARAYGGGEARLAVDGLRVTYREDAGWSVDVFEGAVSCGVVLGVEVGDRKGSRRAPGELRGWRRLTALGGLKYEWRPEGRLDLAEIALSDGSVTWSPGSDLEGIVDRFDDFGDGWAQFWEDLDRRAREFERITGEPYFPRQKL